MIGAPETGIRVIVHMFWMIKPLSSSIGGFMEGLGGPISSWPLSIYRRQKGKDEPGHKTVGAPEHIDPRGKYPSGLS